MFGNFSQPWRTILRVAIALTPVWLVAMCAITRIPEATARTRRTTVNTRFTIGGKKLEEEKAADGKYPAAAPFAAESINDAGSHELTRDFGSLPWDESSKDAFWKDAVPLVYATNGEKYILLSSGPDKKYSVSPMKVLQGEANPVSLADQTYDPTNGMFSPGDMWQMSKPKKE